MGWELIEDGLESGETIEDLPEGYIMSANFYNAFIMAFQERSDYINSGNTSVDYDELLLVNDEGEKRSGILQRELLRRLELLNDYIVNCKINITWYKESAWDEVVALPEDNLLDIRPIPFQPPPPDDLGLVALDTWTDAEVIALIGAETFSDIFESYTPNCIRKALYWSGVYKLLKYVFKYQGMKHTTSAAPSLESVDSPLIYFNGAISGLDSDTGVRKSEDPELPETTSQTALDMLNTMKSDIESSTPSAGGLGSGRLAKYRWLWEEENFVKSGNTIMNVITASSTVDINKYIDDPFFVAPSAMRLEMLAYSVDIYRERTSSRAYAETNPVYEDFYNFSEFHKEKIPASLIDGVYSPDFDTYINYRGHHYTLNPNFDSGVNSISLGFIEDIMTRDKDYSAPAEFTYQGGFHTSSSGSTERADTRLDISHTVIIGELPQVEFEFPL